MCTAQLHTHTHLDTHTATRENCYCRVDWPSGVPGFFPVGRSITGRWTAVFYFIYVFCCLALVTMITLPPGGERHASAWPPVLSCRHSREVTIGPVACLSKEYLAQWPYERPRSPPMHVLDPPHP